MSISAEMAVRLARYFSTSAELWMNLQSSYELATAQKKLKARVEKITPLDEGRIA
jgi:plasmid maintenance system antidote protein VapI